MNGLGFSLNQVESSVNSLGQNKLGGKRFKYNPSNGTVSVGRLIPANQRSNMITLQNTTNNPIVFGAGS